MTTTLSSAITLIRFSAYTAWIDIRNLFARTRLGTLWHAAGLFVLIAVLGVFFGTIFKSDLSGYTTYIPFLGAGLIAWVFLSSSINESCAVFSTRAQVLRHTAQPFAAIPLSVTVKHFVIFLQNILLAMIVYIAVFGNMPVALPTLVLGTIIVGANVFWLSLLAALTCVRFRDLPQLVSGLMHIGFFLTPIIWMEHFLGRYVFLIELNPAYHLVSLLRMPLLGMAPPLESWMVGLALLAVGGSLTAIIYGRVHQKIPYWL